MSRNAIIQLMAILLAFHWSAASCIRKPKSFLLEKRDTISNLPLPEAARSDSKASALEGYIPLTERSELGKKMTDASLVDAIFALNLCNCLAELQKALSNTTNSKRGALPQSLTPAIRREILSNSKLKLLDKLPAPLDQIVGDVFASEETIATQISLSILEKIKKAEPELAQQENELQLQLHLDSFPSLPGTIESPQAKWVQMVDVWSRWGLIFSQAGPWANNRENLSHRILAWHELLRVLAEAEYLFGLFSDNEGRPWGGLTIPVDLQITHPGPFDPRKSFNQVRFLSGVLDLTLPNNNSLSLARSGGERWTWRSASVPLAEQSLQWWIGAKMLNRLRPANRGESAKYFQSDGLIPEDSYQLSLLVLPGIDALLSGRFIDENTRRIQSEIYGAQVSGIASVVRDKADPQTLSLLLLALEAWYSELKSISDLKVSSESELQLKNAPRSLQRGAQLIAQTLLNENLVPKSNEPPDAPTTPWTLALKSDSNIELPIRDHAQILVALIKAEQGILKSSYLSARINQLAVGLAQRLSESTINTEQPQTLSQLIWLQTAASLFAASYPEQRISQTLAQQAAELELKLNEFERSILR